MSEIVIQENASAPGTPSSGNVKIYPKADGLMYSKDDAGTESLMSGSGSSAITSLTGNVTASGPGAAAATIANDAVTFAKMQNIATDSLIGRDTAGSGDPENILLNSTLSMDGAGNLQRAALTGDATASAGSNAVTVAGTAQVDDGNSGTADTIDWGSLKFGRHKSTLTGNVTYTFSNPVAGGVYVLAVFTGAGSFTVTWPGTVKWISAPTVAATAARMDLFTFYYDGTNYYGTYAQGYTP